MTTWLGLAVLFFNVVIGIGLPMTSAQAGPPGTIEICSAIGMVAVQLDGVGEAGDRTSHSGLCVFCLPLMHGGKGAPPAVEIVPVPVFQAVAVAVPAEARRFLATHTSATASPRAPPSPEILT